jgi:hypothetical protein
MPARDNHGFALFIDQVVSEKPSPARMKIRIGKTIQTPMRMRERPCGDFIEQRYLSDCFAHEQAVDEFGKKFIAYLDGLEDYAAKKISEGVYDVPRGFYLSYLCKLVDFHEEMEKQFPTVNLQF